jgi:protein tyrosine/serine phosphatase
MKYQFPNREKKGSFSMKKLVALLLCCLMALSSVMVCAEEAPTVTGKVTEIEKYGHALLDVTIADFLAAGFTLGDVVTVAAGTFNDDMPFFNGYYVDKGAYMVRAYPGHTCIAVCINYGKFAETAGIGVGDSVTITLKTKAGALDVQVMNSLVYTNDRADYATDEIFANFRMVKLGQIGEGKLYRAASPINNENNRAAISNALVEAAGIKAVMNMGDTPDEIASFIAAEDFNSAYYKGLLDEGNVIALGMPIDYFTDDFAASIVAGLNFLASKEGPYLVHCLEGKDRAGFGSMLLEALMGASVEEIVADYMTSYVNYYGIDPVAEADKYNMIAEKNVMDMLRTVCGLAKDASLEGVDLAAAAQKYLTDHGMAVEAVETLKNNLK